MPLAPGTNPLCVPAHPNPPLLRTCAALASSKGWVHGIASLCRLKCFLLLLVLGALLLRSIPSHLLLPRPTGVSVYRNDALSCCTPVTRT